MSRGSPDLRRLARIWPALLVPQRHKRLFAVITLFLDDSDEERGSVIMLAGYVAPADGWLKFEEIARRWFDHCNLPYLHTVDLYRRKKEFEGWSSNQTLEFARDTHSLLAPHVAFGISASVYKPALHPIKDQGSGVFHCFSLIIEHLFENEGVQSFIKEHNASLSVVVECGKYEHEILRAFSNMKKRAPAFLNTLTFEGKDGRVALQMADFLAFFSRRIQNQTLRGERGSEKHRYDSEFLRRSLGDINVRHLFVPVTPKRVRKS